MKKKFLYIFFIIVLLIGIYFHLTTGPIDVSIKTIIKVFLYNIINYHDTQNITQQQIEIIIWESRFPRMIVSFLVGASLSIVGALMQSLFKNPMASPGVTGTSSAAVLGAVISLCLSNNNLLFLPFFSIFFSLIGLLIVYFISYINGRASNIILILVGISFSLFFSSLVSLIITLNFNDWEIGKAILSWTFGSLKDKQWEHVYIVTFTFMIGNILIIYHLEELNILMHGEDIASNFGVSVNKVKFILLLASAIIIGGAVGVSGVIGFIGLVIPHVSRIIIGNDNKDLIPFAGLLGGIFILYCDLLVKIFSNLDLKIGILTSIIGSPYFIFLIINSKRDLI